MPVLRIGLIAFHAGLAHSAAGLGSVPWLSLTASCMPADGCLLPLPDSDKGLLTYILPGIAVAHVTVDCPHTVTCFAHPEHCLLALQDTDKGLLTYILPQIAELNAVAHITVEPWGGLSSVTESAAAELASLLHTYELQGLTVIIRFAQEMNGR